MGTQNTVCSTLLHAHLNFSANVLTIDVVLDDKLQSVATPQSLLELRQLWPVPHHSARTPLLGPASDPHVRAPAPPQTLVGTRLVPVGHGDLVPPECGHAEVGEVPVLQNVNLFGGKARFSGAHCIVGVLKYNTIPSLLWRNPSAFASA